MRKKESLHVMAELINTQVLLKLMLENGVKSGPYRVWLRNENFPGLAMSRSIGDFVAGSVGCICEPGKSKKIYI